MENKTVTIKLKFLRHSARKLNPVARVLRGKKLDDALNLSSVIVSDSAVYANKALKMAASALKDKSLKPENAFVEQIFALSGPKIKRVRPNARGRANSYQKHLAHLVVILGERAEVEKAKPVKKEKK